MRAVEPPLAGARAKTERARARVVSIPNAQGRYELGPMADAYGLGDTLTITPCAARVPAIMLMPERMRYLAPLFDQLCPVRFTEDYPVFPWCGSRPVCESNLSVIGQPANGALPLVKLTSEERTAAKKRLAPYRNPVAVVPTCSRHWQNRRGTTAGFMAPIAEDLSRRFTVLQFGFEDFPLLPGAVRMPWLGVRALAASYAEIGAFVGLNTGDYHLMIAVGGRCLVLDPPTSLTIYNPNIWRYRLPDRVRYVDMRDAKAIRHNLSFIE